VTIAKIRRKTSARKFEIRSVQMLGQRVTIGIVKDEYLREQEFRGCVDVIYSEASVCLSARHTYHVRFNAATRAPGSQELPRDRNPEHLRHEDHLVS
jgi:hypothetical protein